MFFFPEVQVNKKNKSRSVYLQASKNCTDNVLLQFSKGPGNIPNKFGVETTAYGKTFLHFSVPDEDEFEAMKKIKTEACEIAKKNKAEWWPKGITDLQIEDNFNTFIQDKKPKDDGTSYWPGQMKVTIPIDMNTGEARAKILDENGSQITIHDLPGRKWDKIIIELSMIYFQGKYSWGFGPKKLVCVQLAPDNSRLNPYDIEFISNDH